MNWHLIPKDSENALRQASRNHQACCLRRPLPKKHKYLYIQGKTKRETKVLKEKFKEINPKLINLTYPKIRGE